MRVLILVVLCPILWAQSFEVIVENALKSNERIKNLNLEIEQLENQRKIAYKWDNPTITSGYNTLYLSNPTYRNDAMQSISVGISQKLDLFAKKPIEAEKFSLQKQIKLLELKALKKDIIKQIKIQMIKNHQDQNKIRVLNETLKNFSLLKQQINIGTSNFPLDEIYKLEISETKIKLSLQEMLERQRSQIIKLNEITFGNEEEIDFENKIQKNFSEEYYKQSFALKIQTLKEKFDLENIHLAQRSFLSNPTLSVNYFYRQKHPDFISFAISFSLPLYGREILSLKNAKDQSKITKSQTLSLENKIKAQIKSLSNTISHKKKELSLIDQHLIAQLQKLITLYQKNISNQAQAMSAYHQAINDLLQAQLLRIEVYGAILLSYAELESLGETK